MSIHILNAEHGKSASDFICETAKFLERIKQRRHELWILTCYVELDHVEKYVDRLRKIVRLTDIYLAFNFAEIYKEGPSHTAEKLRTIKKNLEKKGVAFEWKALASSMLVHSKGYALIQRSNNDISGGFVLTTSANFTVPGFEGGNIELGYLSCKKKDIKYFEKSFNYLWDKLGTDIDSAILKQEEYLLKYAILSSGIFLHKWSGSLSQHIGIRYELTPQAKEKGTIAPELAAVGFETGDTFTRQVLDLEELPKKEIPLSFIKSFTIETYWGRWCPYSAWNILRQSFDGADKFIQEFQRATEDQTLQKVKHEALEIQNDLTKKGLIKSVSPEHINNWAERIQYLRTNYRLLERFFIGYGAHDLPYSIEQKKDVLELFSSIEESIELSKSINISKKKIISAISNANPDLTCLTNNEKKAIMAMNTRC